MYDLNEESDYSEEEKEMLNKPSMFREYRAVKIFPKAFMNKERDYKKFFNEIVILQQLNGKNLNSHPAIINFHHYFDEPKRFMIVQEHCPIGDFHKQLEAKGGKLDLKRVAYVARQILSAVNYMHEKGIVHRDLKLENILIKSIDESFFDIRLIDFGTAFNF